ncbi:hypothetical protein NIES3275_48030 [Microchaete diplosiphon NIES-3275]|nr:hypothetical protein NIES3275_48030 [Microchaete diplosiphon NIES-3275]
MLLRSHERRLLHSAIATFAMTDSLLLRAQRSNPRAIAWEEIALFRYRSIRNDRLFVIASAAKQSQGDRIKEIVLFC